jgi:hypothetical protein
MFFCGLIYFTNRNVLNGMDWKLSMEVAQFMVKDVQLLRTKLILYKLEQTYPIRDGIC